MSVDSVRQARVQQMLDQQQVGALITWRPDELVLLAGYYPQWGASFCVYPREGAPLLFNPVLEPNDRLPAGVECRDYPWGKAADPWSALLDGIRDALRERGVGREPIGFVPAAARSATGINSAEGQPIDPSVLERLTALSPAGWSDVSGAFTELYLLKTPHEIQSLRLAHQVATVGVHAFYDSLAPQASEAEVASSVEAAVQNQMATHADVQFARAWAFVQSGPNSVFGGTYSRTTGRQLQAGELVMIELAVCVNGYWADITRTGVVRGASPTPQHHEIFEIVAQAQASAVRAVKAGSDAQSVDRVARDIIAERGYGRYYEHHLGHQVGFRYHDPGPTLGPDAAFTLQPGMVVTIEPGIYGAELGAGCRIEDNVVVTADGCEVLSTSAKTLNGA
ncbi:MAG: Xaa-Pro peptidase family protein [Anaerolineae bacterium]